MCLDRTHRTVDALGLQVPPQVRYDWTRLAGTRAPSGPTEPKRFVTTGCRSGGLMFATRDNVVTNTGAVRGQRSLRRSTGSSFIEMSMIRLGAQETDGWRVGFAWQRAW